MFFSNDKAEKNYCGIQKQGFRKNIFHPRGIEAREKEVNEMGKRTSYDRDGMAVKTTPLYQSDGGAGAEETAVLPAISWYAQREDFRALSCVLEFNGAVYDSSSEGPGTMIFMGTEQMFAVIADEPHNLMASGITGESGPLAIALTTVGEARMTIVCPNSVAATLEATADLVIMSVFAAPEGPGADFGPINLSAITAAGAALWGGDGRGGDRPVPESIIEWTPVEGDMPALWGGDGAGGARMSPPGIVWNDASEVFEGYCAALSFDGNDYTDDPGQYPVSNFCHYVNGGYGVTGWGARVAADSEPEELLDEESPILDGLQNIDALLVDIDAAAMELGWLRLTLLCPADQIDDLIESLSSGTMAAMLRRITRVPSLFEAAGAEEDYVFNADAFAGTVETSVAASGTSFPEGAEVFAFTPQSDILIIGIAGEFAAAGADKKLRCMLKINGADAYPVILSETPAVVEVAGRAHCPAGGSVALSVSVVNETGGTATAALLYAEE
jgi:hypothetical protein